MSEELTQHNLKDLKTDYFRQKREETYVLYGTSTAQDVFMQWELDSIGAYNVEFSHISDNIHSTTFDWAYASRQPRKRTVLTISEVELPLQWHKGYVKYVQDADIYLQKASQNVHRETVLKLFNLEISRFFLTGCIT